MDASVIICTYNRADSLKETLKALKSQSIPSECKWEVIVVDNNSRDHTHLVVEKMQRNWPELKYVFEVKQGLAYARNRGIKCAQGKIILFTDDDVIPEPDWMKNIIKGLKQYQADACGGYIAPIWQSPPPSWLTERFYGFLAIRNERTDNYLISQGDQLPFGANMAFKKEVFDKIGLFDTKRGRKGKILASGEDGEMFERIIAAGFKIVFLGEARVHHKVESFRLRKGYFRRWRFQTSKNIAESREISGNRRIFNIPLYFFPQLVRALYRALKSKLIDPPDVCFYNEMIVWHFLGTIAGLLYRSYSK